MIRSDIVVEWSVATAVGILPPPDPFGCLGRSRRSLAISGSMRNGPSRTFTAHVE
jgi:hypothetical protein